MEMKKVKEEHITKSILVDLLDNDFQILAFDFPQSGTGVLLKPEKISLPTMNIDIIALKENCIWFFENKDRYYPKDFDKLYLFKSNLFYYQKSFFEKFKLDLKNYQIKTFIGLPTIALNKIKQDKRKLVDEIWAVNI